MSTRPSAPKRINGGLIIPIKKSKKSRKIGSAINVAVGGGANSGIASTGAIQATSPSATTRAKNNITSSEHHDKSIHAGIPSILSSAPRQGAKSSLPDTQELSNQSTINNDEFADLFNDDMVENDVPSDALLCLQSYTRASPPSGISETCAYCPIFTVSADEATGGTVGNTNIEIDKEMISKYDISMPASAFENNSNQQKSIGSHAVPFLPRHVLIHLLDKDSSSNNIPGGRSNNVDQEIKQLAVSNKVRLLQLHGTAVDAHPGNDTNNWNSKNNAGCGSGYRGDGNDDDDVAIMETRAYEAAAQMALQSYFLQHNQKEGVQQQTISINATIQTRIEKIFQWFTMDFLPYFAGKTWLSSSALELFFTSLIKMSQSQKHVTKQADTGMKRTRWSKNELHGIVNELVHAGLLLPRRGLGLNGGEGYWFSLPGLGQAAKSIASGRLSILRRIKASKYKEKKRSVLEQEIGRNGLTKSGTNYDGWNWSAHNKKKSNIQQSGKYLILDLLAKGWVSIHETCAGDQFVRSA